MASFIHNIFNIQEANNIDSIYSTKFYFKNHKGTNIIFNLKDYINKTNLITVKKKNFYMMIFSI